MKLHHFVSIFEVTKLVTLLGSDVHVVVVAMLPMIDVPNAFQRSHGSKQAVRSGRWE
jgi:hypothetical protein